MEESIVKLDAVYLSDRQEIISKLSGRDKLIFIAEPGNQFDETAVRVNTAKGDVVGYIPPQESAIIFSNLMNNRGNYKAQVLSINDFGEHLMDLYVSYSFVPKHSGELYTEKALANKVCNSCRDRNHGCTDPNCGVKTLLEGINPGFPEALNPSMLSEKPLGLNNDEASDIFWFGYKAGRMTVVPYITQAAEYRNTIRKLQNIIDNLREGIQK